MREIIEILQENRNIERAKSILESNGYKVSKKMNEGDYEDWEVESFEDYLSNLEDIKQEMMNWYHSASAYPQDHEAMIEEGTYQTRLSREKFIALMNETAEKYGFTMHESRKVTKKSKRLKESVDEIDWSGESYPKELNDWIKKVDDFGDLAASNNYYYEKDGYMILFPVKYDGDGYDESDEFSEWILNDPNGEEVGRYDTVEDAMKAAR